MKSRRSIAHRARHLLNAQILLVSYLVLLSPSFTAASKLQPDSGSQQHRIEVGVPFEGEITADDTEIETAALAESYAEGSNRGKTYRFQVEQSGSFHIDLKSYLFDAYLVLRDADGSVIQEDDDGLMSTHPRIVTELEVGHQYQVDVCALRDETGAFSLMLIEGPPPELSPREKRRLALEDAREAVRQVEAVRGREARTTATTSRKTKRNPSHF